MPSRFAPVLTATLVLLVAAACAGTPAVHVDPASPAPVGPTPADRPNPTPVPTPDVVPTPTPSQNAGDVDGWTDGPALTVEFPREDLVDVTLDDPDAKAWRLVVRGTGARVEDRLEIVVEASDVMPLITATEIQQGEVVDVLDLTGYLDGTAAAGGCHRTLDVCIDSSWFLLPENGDGRFAIRLQMPASGTSLVLTGGTAGWPGEPFVLGPWSDTEAFPWGAG
jgi:hypothetical protein